MALGISTQQGDMLPIVKYDAKAGRFIRVDRSQNSAGEWESTPVEIEKPAFLADLHNIEVGWISFANGRPDFRMVEIGNPLPVQPSETHKEGFRVMIKLSERDGGDIRQFSHAARSVTGAFDRLHDEFLAAPESKDKNQVPVVQLTEVEAVRTNHGTNYAPIFEIVKWIERPEDLTPSAAPADVDGAEPPPPDDVDDLPF